MKDRPDKLKSGAYRQDAFGNGQVLLEKKKGRLPAMGWNSWNAFGSGNTEALTKEMADLLVELGLDRLGYRYVVLDDGCYKQERVDGKLSNEEEKFPSGFRALADYIHARGLKFGMYNDIGTNLCAGAAVGTFGHEEDDARSYVDWGVDFLKVDNCYYPWDNATFSDAKNAKFAFAPNIRSIRLRGQGADFVMQASEAAEITGGIAHMKEDYITFVGTYDGTGPVHTPAGEQSSEAVFSVSVESTGAYELFVEYATGEEEGVGSWLQVAVESEAGSGGESVLYLDDFLPETSAPDRFVMSPAIEIYLAAGTNKIRLMNHRRQENTLHSYAALLEAFNKVKPDHEILLSICEWGKTQPQDWGYKVGDSWRILNDITFQVGSDGDFGTAHWKDDYTTSVVSQYNKAVIMDEFAGLDRGWNDPDMLVIGMNGLTLQMNMTHMAMWCMMNAPLMLGLDLRRLRPDRDPEWLSQSGLPEDAIFRIVANRDLIALNQDALGVQAKRVYCSLAAERPDREYIRDTDRVDILAKPLSDGSVALCFINVSEEEKSGTYGISVSEIIRAIGGKMVRAEAFANAKAFVVKDLWTGQESIIEGPDFEVNGLDACANVTWRVSPKA